MFCWLARGTDVAELEPNEEVEDIFTVPLQYFLKNEPIYHKVEFEMKQSDDFPFEMMSDSKKYKWQNIDQQIPFYSLPDHYLWGYTAHLTHRFSKLIKKEVNEINSKDDKNDK